jgi:23S rRNA (guanosine2251-2'-O)-methyltransferase
VKFGKVATMEKIYGRHSVKAVFLTRPQDIRRVIILEGTRPELNEEYLKLCNDAGIKPELMAPKAFDKAVGAREEKKHQGICIFAENRKIYTEKELDELRDAKVVIALDQISNPQNLATIVRSCAFFGVDAVLLLKNRSVDITPTASHVAVGGMEFIKVFKIVNLARSLDKLKELDFWVYGLDERGEKTLAQTDWPEKIVLVVGAEGEGLRHRTREFCDALVRIPGGREGVECLNAGMAVTVALGELNRA